MIARAAYSNPPSHGARIVSAILGDPLQQSEWEEQVKGMHDRIIDVRNSLVVELKKLGTPSPAGVTWDYILGQRGLFSLFPLSGLHVKKLQEKYHIYICSDGRVNLAGMANHAIKYVANAIDDVIREVGQPLVFSFKENL
jgi:aspartate/tyrosine/aromatic aminotransferase